MIRSLGKVAVVTPGTPVSVGSVLPKNTAGVPLYNVVKAIQFQADPANVGVVYVGDRAAMVRATRVGVLAALPKAGAATTGPFTTQSFGEPTSPAHLNVNDFWIDADTAADGVIVSIVSETQT